VQTATQINRNRIGQEKTLVAMRTRENLPESCRQTGTPLGINGCLVNSPEHGRPVGIVFHYVPLFSTVWELIPAVNARVNIKYEFCKGKLFGRIGRFLVYLGVKISGRRTEMSMQ